ncbi:MAG: glycopeptide antibiotics resistance protein [Saprospiraceae bacterium]|jgi:glycopeptide antibiotics resistance protein
MHPYVAWMSKRPLLNALLVVFYYIIVVAPHKKFGTFLNTVVFDLDNKRDQYNLYVIIGATALLALYTVFFFKGSRKRADKSKLWFYMLINILFAIIIVNFLFVVNIEVIHFAQYAAFAILIYPMIRNYNSTLMWTTIAGSIDEAYQNFYLAPNDTGYYDWNDVITNLVGGVFGLLLLKSFGVRQHVNSPWSKSSGIRAFTVMCVLVLCLWLSGYLSIYPSDSSTIQLVSKELTGFWNQVSEYSPPEIVFHIVRPLEGIITTVLLFLFYSRIGE